MATKTITRSAALALLRKKCVALVDEEHSLCQVASRLHILCGGFSQWTSAELRQRYDWIARSRPGITRRALEDLADRWQLARQFALDQELSCDVQLREHRHRICEGWDGHTDEDLARFCAELTDEAYRVVPDPVPSPGELAPG
jgi:hypothetical protein